MIPAAGRERVCTDASEVAGFVGRTFQAKWCGNDLQRRKHLLDFTDRFEGVSPGFIETEVAQALHRLGYERLPGADGVSMLALRLLAHAQPALLTRCLNLVACRE